MAEVKFNDDGVLVNAETGEVFGQPDGNGGYHLDSTGAEMHTLEELGVRMPDESPDDYHIVHQFDHILKTSEVFVPADTLDNDDPPDGNQAKGEPSSEPSAPQQSEAPESRPPAQEAPAPRQEPPAARPPADRGPSSFPIQKTKYEVTPESYFMVYFGLAEMTDGRFASIPLNQRAEERFRDIEKHWAKFRMWTYDEELRWKSESMEYHPASKTNFVSQEKLNEKKIRNLLLDWSFAEHHDRLKLLHCDGRLSDESYQVFRGLMPSIVNTIISLMNNVLENWS